MRIERAVFVSLCVSLLTCGGAPNPNEPSCGDGVVSPGEQCDDGNNAGNDGCSAACRIEIAGVCGDGIINTGEECDDGNFLPGDACMPICENPPKEDTFLFSDVDNLFDTAEYCDAMVTRHAAARAVDLEDGNLRWRCGDVTGISPSQYGQEYCEYFAFANGGRVDAAAGLSLTEPSYCVFTAVFSDKTARGPSCR